MQLELSAAREQQKLLADELQVQRTRNEVDRRALEMVRQELAAQKERIAELGEGLRFYTSLMAPGGRLAMAWACAISSWWRARSRGTTPTELWCSRRRENTSYSRASCPLRCLGTLGEEPASYSLAELSDDIGESALPLRFRYFQAIEGELILPAGFEPLGCECGGQLQYAAQG